MSNRKYFGTDGIRGKANVFPMTGEIAMKLGRAVTYYFQQQTSRKIPLIIIGKDTRKSCYMLEHAFAAGVCSQGGEAILTGPMPTPGIAFVTRSMRANAGVMISASHNSFEDNGIKIFDSLGLKLPDEVELELENLIDHQEIIPPVVGESIGRARRLDEVRGRYIEKVKSSFDSSFTLDGIKLVVDAANGAAWRMAAGLFEELGAHVIAIGNKPNGSNINDGCGAMSPEQCAEAVKKNQAFAGICLDGDGDRIVLIDEKGEVIDGDKLIGLLASYLIKRNKITKDQAVVGTVMTNMGLEKFLNNLDIKLERTPVGDRYIIGKMLKASSVLGGEPSGHVILKEYSHTGDGLVSGLKALEACLYLDKNLSELSSLIELYPQKTVSIKVKEKKSLSETPAIQTALQLAEKKIEDKGRVLLRYSGTEPKIRVMIEHQNQSVVDSLIEELSEVIKKSLA